MITPEMLRADAAATNNPTLRARLIDLAVLKEGGGDAVIERLRAKVAAMKKYHGERSVAYLSAWRELNDEININLGKRIA
jgi:hypothetical protein